MAPTPTSTTNSGIRKLSNGDTVIPSSTRPDGSVRKEIRVKPGYKPPEDVEVYKNRTSEAWKTRGNGGVPGAEATADEPLPPHKAAANKNAKRREARKRAAATAADANEEEVDDAQSEAAVNGDSSVLNGETPTTPEQAREADPEADATKEARKLAKKLRQARDLKDKKDRGDNLLPEQFAKVVKISELVRQLDSLGFDAEGEKKQREGDAAAAD